MQLKNKSLSVIILAAVLLISANLVFADEKNFWVQCDLSYTGSCPATTCPTTSQTTQKCGKGGSVSVYSLQTDGTCKDEGKQYCCWSTDGTNTVGKWIDTANTPCPTSQPTLSVDKTVGKREDTFTFTIDVDPFPKDSPYNLGGYQAKLEYTTEGGSSWTICGSTQLITSDPWSAGTIPSSACSITTDGKYDFRANILEPNPATSNRKTLTLDSTAPTTAAQCSTDGGTNYGACKTSYYNVNVKVKPTCDDGSGSGCDKSYYCGWQDCNLFTECTANSCSETTFVDEGTNYYSFYSKDKTSNTESVNRNKEIKIDKTAPTVSVTGAPTDWTNTNKDAGVSCTDNTGGSGCDTNSYRLKIYDTEQTTCPNNYADYSLNPPQTISKRQWVCAAAKDFVGFAGFSNPVEFKVEKTPPTTSFSTSGTIGQNSWYTTDVSVSLSCSDTGGSGCKETNYCSGSSTCTQTTIYSSSFSVAIEGTTNINYYSTDNAGNTETSKSNSVKIDKTDPATSILCNDATCKTDWYTTTVTVTLSCNDGTSGVASGCQTTKYSWDNVNFVTYNPNSKPQQSQSGTYTIYYYSEDNAGRKESTKSTAIKIDVTPPQTPTLSDPGIWDTDGIVAWSWSAVSDNTGGSGLKHYRIQTSESSNFATSIEVTTAGTSYISGLADGKTYYARVRAEDNVNNAGSWSSTADIKIDKTKPSTAAQCSTDNVNYVSCGSNWYLSNVYVKLACTDTTSGCKETKYCTSAGCTPNTVYSTPLQISGEGTNTIRFNSTDNAGLEEDTKSVEIKIDKTDPRTSVQCNSADCSNNWYTTAVTFTLTCSDSISGCKTTLYSFDNDVNFVAYNPNSKPSASTDGTRTIYYKSEDNAGRKESTKSNTVKIDKTQPSLTISYTPSSISVVDEVTFTAAVSDSASGLSTATISIDGQLKKTCTYNGETSQQNCVYVSPAFGSGSTGKHTISSTATDKAGNSQQYNGEFTVEPCNFGPVSIASLCSGGYSVNCEPGEKVRVTVTYSGKCPSNAYVQVDAFADQSGTCDIIDQDRTLCETKTNKLTGINVQCTSSVCVGEWTIPSTAREFPNNCKGKTVTADGSTIRNNYPCAGGKSYNSATATGSIKFWSDSECNNPGVCDFPFEKQTHCPNDCKTKVTINPYYVYPNVEVDLTIEFEDGRYDSGHEVSFVLEIVDQGIIWDRANGCISGERLSINTALGDTSQDGKAKIVRKCTVPSNIAIGVHTLRATPSFYSEETKLNPAEAKVAFGQEENEQNFFEFLLGYITRFLAGS